MAKKSLNKKNLTLDSVTVTYDARSDSIHLTSKDKDFQKGDSFHLVLNKGSEAEETLRKLLHTHNLVPENKTHALPKIALFDQRNFRDDTWDSIPLGILNDRSELSWKVKVSPHSLFYGTPGGGKSILERIIIDHTQTYKDKWSLYGVDLTKIEFSGERSKSFKQISQTIEDASNMLKEIEEEMFKRYELMESKNAFVFSEADKDLKATLVLFDNFSSLFKDDQTKIKTEIERLEIELARQKIVRSVENILRLGRAAGVFLAIFTNSEIPSEILNKVLGNVGFRVIAGAAYKETSKSLLNSPIASKTPPIRGRSSYNKYGEVSFFQAYYKES